VNQARIIDPREAKVLYGRVSSDELIQHGGLAGYSMAKMAVLLVW